MYVTRCLHTRLAERPVVEMLINKIIIELTQQQLFQIWRKRTDSELGLITRHQCRNSISVALPNLFVGEKRAVRHVPMGAALLFSVTCDAHATISYR